MLSDSLTPSLWFFFKIMVRELQSKLKPPIVKMAEVSLASLLLDLRKLAAMRKTNSLL